MTLEIYTDHSIYSAICRDFWQMNEEGAFKQTISEIAKTYNMVSKDIQKIAKQNCACFSTRKFCEVCKIPYQFANRTDYTSQNAREKWICQTCKNHLAQTVLDAKYKFLTRLAEAALPIDPYNLSVRQLILLVSLARFAANESMNSINALNSIHEHGLTPDSNYSAVIVRELFVSKLIVVNPNTNLERIIIQENNNYSININEVDFLFSHPNPAGLIATIEERILAPGFNEEHKAELELLAHEITLQECIAYLCNTLEKHRLYYSPGEKTLQVLKKGLEVYSVAQMCNFIWRAAKDAAAYYVRNRVSKDHAAKTVVGSIDRQMERALANQWNITGYKRDYDYPQSVLSRILFNNIYKTDDGGFYKRVSELVL